MVDKQESSPVKKQRGNIDQEIREKLEAEGWQLAGTEHPKRTRLNAESGKFEDERVLSDEQIKQDYLNKYGGDGFQEIRIEPSHKHILDNPNAPIVEDDSRLFVYVRKK